MYKSALATLALFAAGYAQQVGTQTAESHPKLTWYKCTKSGTTNNCTTQNGSITLDANWRWLHTTSGYTNCYTGNKWDTSLAPDGATCAKNCALDGANYSSTYGITTSGDALTLKFVTKGDQTNVGSRVYLMADDSHYQMFNLVGQEISFDVDVSKLPCGLNGAVYTVEMEADGGSGKYPNNKAGAKYGTGYCDSQCPRDIKYINGECNVSGWTADSNSENSGKGQYGACCNEMDLWEANSVSTAYTPHPCTNTGVQKLAITGGRYDTPCDPDGCDFNSYRQGDTSFYGPGKTVNTNSKFTVTTQFITDTGTTSGNLKEIRRIYVQGGKVIQNSKTTFAGINPYDSITAEYCKNQKALFQDTDSFGSKGGLPVMGTSLKRGHVLVLSIWDDYAVNMLWLDSTYPTDANPSKPGIARGTCATTSGVPKEVEANGTNIQVIYSNIRVGEIGSTYSGTGGTGTTTGGTTTGGSGTTTQPPTSTQTKYGQCGGQGWTGPTQCVSGSSCQAQNSFYSQCI